MFDLNSIKSNNTSPPMDNGKTKQELLDFLDKQNVVSRRLLISAAGVRDSFLDPEKLSAFIIEWKNGMRLHSNSPDYATQMVFLKHKIINVIAYSAIHYIGDVSGATELKEAIGTKGTMKFNNKISKVLAIMRPALQTIETIFPALEFPLNAGTEVLGISPSVKFLYDNGETSDLNSIDLDHEISSIFTIIAKNNDNGELTLNQERELNILTTLLTVPDNDDEIHEVIYVKTKGQRLVEASVIDKKVASSERANANEAANVILPGVITDTERLFNMSNVKLDFISEFEGEKISSNYEVDDKGAEVHARFINSPVTIAELLYISKEGSFVTEVANKNVSLTVDIRGIGRIPSSACDNLCNLVVLLEGKDLFRYMPHSMQFEYQEIHKLRKISLFNAHNLPVIFSDRLKLQGLKSGQLDHFGSDSNEISEIAYTKGIGMLSDHKLYTTFINIPEFFAVSYKNDEVFSAETGGTRIDKTRALMQHFDKVVIDLEYISLLLVQISTSNSGRALEARKFAQTLNDAKNRDSVKVQEIKAIHVVSTPAKILYERVFTNDNTVQQKIMTAIDLVVKSGKIDFTVLGEYEKETMRIKAQTNDEHPDLTMAVARVDRGEDEYVTVSDVTLHNPTPIPVEQMDTMVYDINIKYSDMTGGFGNIIDGINYGQEPANSINAETKVADILPSTFLGVDNIIMMSSSRTVKPYNFSYLEVIQLSGLRLNINLYKHHKNLRKDESMEFICLSDKYRGYVSKVVNVWIDKKRFKQIRFDDSVSISRSVRSGYKLSDFMKLKWETRLYTQPMAYDPSYLLIGETTNELRTYSRKFKEIRCTKFAYYVNQAHAFNIVKIMIDEKYFFRIFSESEYFDYADASQLKISIAKYRSLFASFQIHEKLSIHFLVAKRINAALAEFNANTLPGILNTYAIYVNERADHSSNVDNTRNELYRQIAMSPVALWNQEVQKISVEMSTLKALIGGY